MKRYPKEIRDFIAKNVAGTTTKDLIKLVNEKFGTDFTDTKMRSYKKNNNLKSGTPLGLPAGRPTKQYPEEVQKFIMDNHIGVGPRDMAELLNKTFNTNYTAGQLKSYYGNHNINSGLKGHFTKGHVPFNKGKKGTGGWEPTQFKKGHMPHNWVPIGSERISKDGYIQIKIKEGQFQKNWKGKHILIWEEKNGPVPEGHAVIFGDGDKRNFDQTNLILVSRKQLVRLNQNGLIQNDADLTRSAIIAADIISKISERKKEIKTRRKCHEPETCPGRSTGKSVIENGRG